VIELAGYRVLVTGGSRGIGAACCRLLAEAGATVAVHYRRAERAADELLERLPSPAEGAHLALAADLAEPHGVAALFDRLAGEWAGLDVLVNNAGIWQEDPLEGLTAERLEETFAINLRAPFLCAAAALPLLRRSTRACVINIASTAGQRGEPFHSPYAASKGALIAATRSWAGELAPAIRVNAVAPGWVDTDMCSGVFADGGRERIEQGIPLGRVASPEDIAGSVVFLASPLARHLTGSVVSVNGGGVLAS
jgi:3-oxoacyl-[acyl-carrier protein] reductase